MFFKPHLTLSSKSKYLNVKCGRGHMCLLSGSNCVPVFLKLSRSSNIERSLEQISATLEQNIFSETVSSLKNILDKSKVRILEQISATLEQNT